MRVIYCLILLLTAFFAGCHKESSRIKIAATTVPHAELLEFIRPEMEKRGVRLEIVEVDDYNIPNRLLAERQVDANFFQHIPFLEEQKKNFGYHLEVLVPVHIEPLGLYSKKITSLDQLREGAIIAVPNDPTNEARALLLLQSQGLISLKEGRGHCVSILDIRENPKYLKFREIDAALLPRILDDVDGAVINANFALQAHLYPKKDALLVEQEDSPYVNVIVIREGEQNRDDLQLLAELMNSEILCKHIEEKYQGAIEPAFKNGL